MSLSAWFPGPVPIKVGGRVVLASQLRLRDLGTLEAFVAARLGGPVDSLDPASESYGDDLRERYDTISDGGWPPSPSSPEWSLAIFADKPGLESFLSVVLRNDRHFNWRRKNPKVVSKNLAFIARDIAPDEFSVIENIAWALEWSARDAICRAIDKHLGLPEFAARDRGEPGMRVTWSKAIAGAVCGAGEIQALPWATPKAVGNLWLSQWRMICRGGESDDQDDPLPEDPKLTETVNAARREFFGPIGTPVIEPSIPTPPSSDGAVEPRHDPETDEAGGDIRSDCTVVPIDLESHPG